MEIRNEEKVLEGVFFETDLNGKKRTMKFLFKACSFAFLFFF